MRAFFTHSPLTPPVFFWIRKSITTHTAPHQLCLQPASQICLLLSIATATALVPATASCQLHHCKPASLPSPLESPLYPQADMWDVSQRLSLYSFTPSRDFSPLRTSNLLHHLPDPTWEPLLTSSPAAVGLLLTAPRSLFISPGEPSGQDSLLGIPSTWNPLPAPSSASDLLTWHLLKEVFPRHPLTPNTALCYIYFKALVI